MLPGSSCPKDKIRDLKVLADPTDSGGHFTTDLSQRIGPILWVFENPTLGVYQQGDRGIVQGPGIRAENKEMKLRKGKYRLNIHKQFPAVRSVRQLHSLFGEMAAGP